MFDTDKQGNLLDSIEVDGIQREYIAHFGPNFDSSKLQSLILVLHGAKATNQFMMGYTAFNNDIDRSNYVAIYPQSLTGKIPGTVDEVLTWDPYLNLQHNDVNFLTQLINKAVSDYSIDPSRVFLVGLSIGGFMGFRFLSEAADNIAGAAIVSAQLPLLAAKTMQSKRVPLLTVHATNDHIIPYNEGIENYSMSVPDTLKYFSERFHCGLKPDEYILEKTHVDDQSHVVKEVYKSSQENFFLEHYRIVGDEHTVSHTWPRAAIELDELGTINRSFHINQVIIDFFDRC